MYTYKTKRIITALIISKTEKLFLWGKTDFNLDRLSLKSPQQLHTYKVNKPCGWSSEDDRAAAKTI